MEVVLPAIYSPCERRGRATVPRGAGSDPRSAVELEVVRTLGEGLARLRPGQNPVDVILLDLHLPDGLGLTTFLRLQPKAGDRPVVLENSRAVRDDQGQVIYYEGTLTDITELHELSRQLSYEASHDALSGLINRHEFELRLQRALDSVQAGSTHAVCYLDLDQYKIINDTCGHIAGDELLRQLAQVLPGRVRATTPWSHNVTARCSGSRGSSGRSTRTGSFSKRRDRASARRSTCEAQLCVVGSHAR